MTEIIKDIEMRVSELLNEQKSENMLWFERCR
jgi:hypothetical protein